MKPNKNKNKNILKLTLALFLPVAFLVTILFSVSVLVFQNSINQIDYEILDFENIRLERQIQFESNLESSLVGVQGDLSSQTEVAYPNEVSLDSFEQDILPEEESTFKQEVVSEIGDTISASFVSSQVDIETKNKVYEQRLKNSLDVYLEKIEEDAYKNALVKIFPIFSFLIILMLAFSYIAARMMIRPIVKTAEKQKRFIANASHEIKTPLSLMKSEIEVFQKQHKDVDPNRLEVDTLNKNLLEDINRLKVLSEKLLHIARLDSKKESKLSDLKRCEVGEVADIIDNLVEGFSRRYPDKKISFEKENFSSKIITDCESVKQVIEILIENACLHMVNGNRVDIVLKERKGLLKIEVSDNGKGISTEDKTKVFDRFYRSKNSYGVEGTGLGLSIAKELVEKYGGSILIKDDLKKGTTFVTTYKAEQGS